MVGRRKYRSSQGVQKLTRERENSKKCNIVAIRKRLKTISWKRRIDETNSFRFNSIKMNCVNAIYALYVDDDASVH